MKCLKSVLADPSLIAKWAQIYREQNASDQPEILAESKRLDAEISQVSRKVTNLIQRVSDLPADISADGFYDQIRQMTQKKEQLQLAREKVGSKLKGLTNAEVDQDGLLKKIQQAVERIEQASVDKQRPIFKEVVHRIEILPMKLKIELYAPTTGQPCEGPETQKATGTDGLPVNLKRSEASILPFEPSARRVGSSTVGDGAPGRT